MARSAVPAVLGGPPAASSVNPFWRLHREIDRAFDDVFHELGDFGVSGGALAEMTPRIDASDTDREITICAELPGVSADDIEVELVDDMLTIRGEKRAEKEKKNESYHLMERSYGSFVRSIRLPFAVEPEQVAASFENGVLTITVPKPPAQQSAHRIPVQGAGASKSSGADLNRPPLGTAGGKPGAAAGSEATGESPSGQETGESPSGQEMAGQQSAGGEEGKGAREAKSEQSPS